MPYDLITDHELLLGMENIHNKSTLQEVTRTFYQGGYRGLAGFDYDRVIFSDGTVGLRDFEVELFEMASRHEIPYSVDELSNILNIRNEGEIDFVYRSLTHPSIIRLIQIFEKHRILPFGITSRSVTGAVEGQRVIELFLGPNYYFPTFTSLFRNKGEIYAELMQALNWNVCQAVFLDDRPDNISDVTEQVPNVEAFLIDYSKREYDILIPRSVQNIIEVLGLES